MVEIVTIIRLAGYCGVLLGVIGFVLPRLILNSRKRASIVFFGGIGLVILAALLQHYWLGIPFIRTR